MDGINSNAPVDIPMLIDGAWVHGGESFDSIDPYRGDVVSRAPVSSAADVDAAIEAARRAAPLVAAMPAAERARILRRVGELIAERFDEIGIIMARETGKAVKDAKGEVKRSQDTIQLSAEEAVRIEGEHVPLDSSEMGNNKMAFMMRFPVGVIAAVTPFNAPFNLACHKLAPALAAGNSVILKPPQQCPLVVHKLVEMFVDAGLPAGFINVVYGGPDVGRQLVSDPRVDFITFTGSSRAGAEIRKSAGLKRVALELGGNGPTIVCKDADVDKIAPMLAVNSTRLAGQSCISVQNIYVHESLREKLTGAVAGAMEKLRVGDPMDPETDIGTLVDEQAAVRVEQWIADAVDQGARLVTGGKRSGAQITPALLADVTPDMKIVCDEVFGPAANILGFTDIDEPIRQINASPYGLQCGVITDSNATAMKVARSVRTGGVIINGTSTWRTDQLAYGGVKDSGIGREGPRYAMRDMTEQRLILFNL